VVDPKPLQRRITGPPHILRFPVDPHPAAVGSVLVAELGGQYHLVSVSDNRPPDQPLVAERPVHVGGVQQGDAEVERAVDGGDRLPVVGRPVRLAHHHAAQAYGGDPQTLAAERALLHPAFLGDRPRVSPKRRGAKSPQSAAPLRGLPTSQVVTRGRASPSGHAGAVAARREHRHSCRPCHPRAISSGHERYVADSHGHFERAVMLGTCR
jgi:hypothetical protein